MTHNNPSPAETRRLTEMLRDWASAHHGTAFRDGLSIAHESTNRRAAMRHTLTYWGPTKSGSLVMFHPPTREAWILPGSRAADRYNEPETDGSPVKVSTPGRALYFEWAKDSRESGFTAAMLGEFDRQGYTMIGGSETMETLDAYRAAPRDIPFSH